LKDYDGIFLFDPAMEEGILEEKIGKIEKTIKENGGEILDVNRWGKMPLSYPIKRQRSGFYFIARFSGNPQVLQRLEESIKYEEGLLRHLITKSEGFPLHESRELER